MKRFLIVLLVFNSLLVSAQKIAADQVIVRQGILVKDRWIDSVQQDTAFDGRVRSVPTSDAVSRYVKGRLGLYAPERGSGNYIWNGTTQQPGSFNISGTGQTGSFTAVGDLTTYGVLKFARSGVNPSYFEMVSSGDNSVGLNYYSRYGIYAKRMSLSLDSWSFDVQGLGRFSVGNLFRLANKPTTPTLVQVGGYLNGDMYYDNTYHQFSGYRDGVWKYFLMSGDAISNQLNVEQNASFNISGSGTFGGNVVLNGASNYLQIGPHSIFRNGGDLQINSANGATFYWSATQNFRLQCGSNYMLIAHSGGVEIFNTLYLKNNRAAPTVSNAPAANSKGEIRFDSNYLYIKVDESTWKRVPLSTW